MDNLKKAISLIGMTMLTLEYLEDLMNDDEFKNIFVREMKRDAKSFLRSSEKLINKISENGNTTVTDQMQGVYLALSSMIEEQILWQKDEEETIKT